MALDDFRRWIDVDAQDGRRGAIAIEAAPQPDNRLRLLIDPPQPSDMAWVDLDYSDAGLLLDALREGMGVLLARTGHPSAIAAVAGVQLARDTPGEG